MVAALVAVPLGIGAWALSSLAGSTDAVRTGDALVTTLHAVRLDLAEREARAQLRATRVAAAPAIQHALARGDLAALQSAAPADTTFVVHGSTVGPAPSPLHGDSAVRTRSGRVLGRVVVSVVLDRDLLASVERRSLVSPVTTLLLLENGHVVAGPAAGSRASVSTTRQTTVDLGGTRYVARAEDVPGTALTLAALAPQTSASVPAARRRLWLLLATLATLATVAAAAFAAAPTIPRLAPRARAERRRGGELVALVGEALGSTHDRTKLLEVILDATVEVTGAVAAQVVEDEHQVVLAVGTPGRGGRVELPLGEGGGRQTVLVLHAPRGGFAPAVVHLAASIAVQGQIALENVSLHHLAEERALTDELTGLANRRQFRHRLELELRRGERFDESVAVVLADLDHFKSVNDRFGHAIGDEVLRRFADVLRAHSREVDLPARLGGEEFALILPGTERAGAEAFAERLRAATEALRSPARVGGEVRVTASFGIAGYPAAATAEELVAAADAALYRAKSAGRNTVAVA